MTRVYVADALTEERSALRLLLLDLKMEVVGEAADWLTTLANAPATNLDLLLIDWALVPVHLGAQALAKLRIRCPNAIAIVMLSNPNAYQQSVHAVGADIFIRKDEMPEQVAKHLLLAAASAQVIPVG